MTNREPRPQTNDTAFNEAVNLLAQRFDFSDLALAQAIHADTSTVGDWRKSLKPLSEYDNTDFRIDTLLLQRRVLISKVNILLAHLSHEANLRQLLNTRWPGTLHGKSLREIALTLPRDPKDLPGLQMVRIALEDWAKTNVPGFDKQTYWLET